MPSAPTTADDRRPRGGARKPGRTPGRLVMVTALGATAAIGVLAPVAACGEAGTENGSARAASGENLSPSPSASRSSRSASRPSPAGAVASAPSPAPVIAAPAILRDFIPYGPARRRQMAAYSLRHYGVSGWRLRPRLIVLHYTAGPTYAAARAVFASNARNLGELPGVAAHFVIDKEGTIYQSVPLDVRVRHAIGLNDRALAIEMVQEDASGPRWADAQILARPAQSRSALRLVRYLCARFDIRRRDVIGHAMANDSPFFHDLLGWRNDHVDWQAADVRVFRSHL
jgi:hypothetical protein